jgi:argininosuccinate synthase
MWAITGEGGEIENPELIPPLENILKWSNTPQQAPDKEELVKIGFEKGEPVSLNGVNYDKKDLILLLNEIGGKHAVGVFHLIEDRVVGLKVRCVYENPAATILIQAHKNLEQLVSTREENELKNFMDQKWAYLIYGAKYFEPVMDNIRAYINEQNKKVTGEVTVADGAATTAGRYSLSRGGRTGDRDGARWPDFQITNRDREPGAGARPSCHGAIRC